VFSVTYKGLKVKDLKKGLLRKIFFSCSLCLIISHFVKAQEVTYTTGNTYYWNPFENGSASLGSFSYRTTGAANYTVVSTNSPSPLAGSNSLVTVNRTTPLANGIFEQILPSAASFSATTTYEWSFLYSYSTNDATNASDIVDYTSVTTGKCGWRYWLASNNTNPSASGGTGLYVTQVGKTLTFYDKTSNTNTFTVASTNLSPNTVYNIKCRVINNGICVLFADPYTATKKDATTKIGSANFGVGITSYSYTGLEANEARSSSSYHCQWDDFKLYVPTFSMSAITSTANGISNSVVEQGQQDIVTYGFSITTRGVYNIKNLNVNDGNSNSSQIINAANLYTSTDNNFSVVSDPSIISFGVPTSSNLSATYSIDLGNSDVNGITTYYFFTVGLTPNALFSGQVLQFSNPTLNYDNYNGSVTAGTTSTSGPGFTITQSYTWTGATNTDWNTKTNWKLTELYQTDKTPTSPPVTGAYVYIPNAAANDPISTVDVNLGGM
jgi:hypothetical protein